MNTNQVKGTVKAVVGKARRKVGEAVDSPTEQVIGGAELVAGIAQKAVGDLQDEASSRRTPADRKP